MTVPVDAAVTVPVTPVMFALPPVATVPAWAVVFTSPVAPATAWDRTPALIPAGRPRRMSGWPCARLPGEPVTAVTDPACVAAVTAAVSPVRVAPAVPADIPRWVPLRGTKTRGRATWPGEPVNACTEPAGAVTVAVAGVPVSAVPANPADIPDRAPFLGTKVRGLTVRPGEPVTAVTVPAGEAAVTVAVAPGITWVSVPPETPCGLPFCGTKVRGRMVLPGEPVTAWVLPAGATAVTVPVTPVMVVPSVPAETPRTVPLRTKVRGRATFGREPDTRKVTTVPGAAVTVTSAGTPIELATAVNGRPGTKAPGMVRPGTASKMAVAADVVLVPLVPRDTPRGLPFRTKVRGRMAWPGEPVNACTDPALAVTATVPPAPVTASDSVPGDTPRTAPLRTNVRGRMVRPGEPVNACTAPALAVTVTVPGTPAGAAPIVPREIPRTAPLRTKVRGCTDWPGEPVNACTEPGNAVAVTVAVAPLMNWLRVPPVTPWTAPRGVKVRGRMVRPAEPVNACTDPAGACACARPGTPVAMPATTNGLPGLPCAVPRRMSGRPWAILPGLPVTACTLPAGDAALTVVVTPVTVVLYTPPEKPLACPRDGWAGVELPPAGTVGFLIRRPGEPVTAVTIPAPGTVATVPVTPVTAVLMVPRLAPRALPFDGSAGVPVLPGGTVGFLIRRPGEPVTAWTLPAGVAVAAVAVTPVMVVLAAALTLIPALAEPIGPVRAP